MLASYFFFEGGLKMAVLIPRKDMNHLKTIVRVLMLDGYEVGMNELFLPDSHDSDDKWQWRALHDYVDERIEKMFEAGGIKVKEDYNEA